MPNRDVIVDCARSRALFSSRHFAPLLCLGVVSLLLAGCLTQKQLIERRISQKSDFFATLPIDSQQRLREGKLNTGDARDAVWIVYGRPDRVYQKVTAAATNEVWSYVTQTPTGFDEPRPAYYPVTTSKGRTFWRQDPLWAPRANFETYEYQRIEFQNDHVLSIESEQP